MSSLDQAKILGGIGSILTLLGLAPFGTGTVLVIVGWILILIALKNVSDAVQDTSIFNYAIIAAGLSIIGNAALGFIFGFSIFATISRLSSSNPVGVIGSIILGLLLLWVLAIIASVFLYLSFKTVASKLSVGLFSAAALIYVIGEGLTIVLIGFIIALIAQILFAVAFFSLPAQVPVGTAPPSTTSTQTGATLSGTMTPTIEATRVVGERKFCAKCGHELDPGASFCAYCGARANI